ncbi:MAG: fibronectin type III domain-containing protein, partial [Bacteroidales bacterium]
SLGSEYTGTTKRLYFRWTNIDHYNIGNPGAIDNISIMGFNCTRPTTLSAANITGNTVDISFVPGHVSDTEWEYAIGAFGSNPDNLTPVPVTSTTFTISNLSSSSLYHLYIRTICNDGTSDWSDLLTFRTNCGTISTLPYLENFDFYASGTYPACWIRFPYPNSSYPIVAEGTYYSPSRSLYFYTDSWGASNNMIIAP